MLQFPNVLRVPEEEEQRTIKPAKASGLHQDVVTREDIF